MHHVQFRLKLAEYRGKEPLIKKLQDKLATMNTRVDGQPQLNKPLGDSTVDEAKPMTDELTSPELSAKPSAKPLSAPIGTMRAPTSNVSTNPLRSPNKPAPSPEKPQKFTSVPMGRYGKIAAARNTGIVDVDGVRYVNNEDVELLGKLGFVVENYSELEKTSEVLDVYSYVEKVAGVPRAVAKALDKSEAFSGSFLEDMGYSVPEGYEVKGDLCCPVEKTAMTPEQLRHASVLRVNNRYDRRAHATMGAVVGGLKGGLSGLIWPGKETSSTSEEAQPKSRLDAMRDRALVGAVMGAGFGFLGGHIGREKSIRAGLKRKSDEDLKDFLKTYKHIQPRPLDDSISNKLNSIYDRIRGNQKAAMDDNMFRTEPIANPATAAPEAMVKKQLGDTIKGGVIGKLPLQAVGKKVLGGALSGISQIGSLNNARERWNKGEHRPAIVQGIGAAAGSAAIPFAGSGIGAPVAAALKGIELGTTGALARHDAVVENKAEMKNRLNWLKSRPPAGEIPNLVPGGPVAPVQPTQPPNTLLAKRGAEDKTLFDKLKDILNKEYMGMTIRPRIEIMTPTEVDTQFAKTAAADPSQTILVTGHSGAGKSTLAKALAEKLNLPLHRVDAQTSWDDLRAHFEKHPAHERKALVPGTTENKQYLKDVRKIVGKSLKEIDGPAILEGTQVTTLSPKQLAKYKASVLVGGDVEQSIAQRLQRSTDKAAKKGITFTPEELAKKKEESRFVADSWHPGMEKFKKIPGVINYNHTEHELEPLIKRLQRLLHKKAVAAWQRSEGKNPEGGLNAKGRASYKRETGGTLKAPVGESNPTGERAKRQHSFCSRMCGMKSKNTGSKGQSDPDSRINKSLRKWNCKCGEDHDSLFEKVACLVKYASESEKEDVDPRKLKNRFRYWAHKLDRDGVLAGTYHKRIAIPKFRLPEEHIKALGFEPSLIAIPEAGQDKLISYRNLKNLYHIHSHGDYWTMHEDEHPSLSMALKNARLPEIPHAIADGLSHVVTEGVPGAYKFVANRLKGSGGMLDAVMNEFNQKKQNDKLQVAQ